MKKGKSKNKSSKKPSPTPYKESQIPVIDPCQHSYCIIKRDKKKAKALEKPKGLLWSTGLLKHLPGTEPKYVPYRFPDSSKNKQPTGTKKSQKPGQKGKEKTEAVSDVCEQMMFLLKIILMAKEILGEPINIKKDEVTENEQEIKTTALTNEEEKPPAEEGGEPKEETPPTEDAAAPPPPEEPAPE